jgi:acetate kinase
MSGTILVINSGSSSVKFAAFADGAGSSLERVVHGEVEDIAESPHLLVWSHEGALLEDRRIALPRDSADAHESALIALLGWLGQHAGVQTLRAVGHRVVHGGELFIQPTRVTPDVIARLADLNSLAPLHQPHNLSAMRAIAGLQPALPQIACFDTAFALPRHLSQAGVKRYGFHGLSYEYIASVLPDPLGEVADGRVVVAHLGNGASLCAMRGRKSVATTMGLTALDGLMMGTRCGSLDPGAVLYLIQDLGLHPAEVEKLLYEQSGLLGVSGISADMRTLEASAEPDAQAAIDLYVHRIARELGSLAATLGGIDALVLTAGIGEHSAAIRARVCRDAAWLGVELDEQANAAGGPRISSAASRVSAWVIPTNEELMIALHVRTLLGGPGPG